MKIVVKLLIAVLIANGAWRVGQAYMSHYKFTDAVKEMTRHRGTMTDAQVDEKVFDFANQYSIPVNDQSLTISHEDMHQRTVIKGSYMRPIDLLPGFAYQWPFSIDIETYVSAPERLDGR